MDKDKLPKSLKSKKAFDEAFSILSVGETFYELLKKIMSRQHCNSTMFCDSTGLNKTILLCRQETLILLIIS